MASQWLAAQELPPPEEQSGCRLMDTFAVILQGFMALLAFSTLLLKRCREHPQRPFRIWFFDTSKQACGAAFVHFLNVLISWLFGEGARDDATGKNPCVWYFLNVLVDTTIGVFILLLCLKLVDFGMRRYGYTVTISGQYGHPPSYRVWLRQLGSFLVALMLTKIVVIILLQLHVLFVVGTWFVSPIQDPHAQLVVVMLLFPLVMNILQFWLVDNLIKAKVPDEDVALLANDGSGLEESVANLLANTSADSIADASIAAKSPPPLLYQIDDDDHMNNR